jgi:hypothetical protein
MEFVSLSILMRKLASSFLAAQNNNAPSCGILFAQITTLFFVDV